MKNIPITLFVCMLGVQTWAQSLATPVTLQCEDEPLGAVLTHMSRKYAIRFSYSPDFVPVHSLVSLEARETPLSDVLDDIDAQVGLKYAAVGGQVLLKPAKASQKLGQLTTLPGEVRQTSPIYPEPVDKVERERLKSIVSPIQREQEISVLQSGGGDSNSSIQGYRLETMPPSTGESYIWDNDRLAQISLVPFLGTNAEENTEITNNVSFNVLWGDNGGVEGLEVGGLVNKVRNDVMGMQIAGLVNTVGGNVEGTQISGLCNVNKGKTSGLQVAGLINTTGEGHAVQIAGLGNKVKRDHKGLQIAGLFNHSGGKAEGGQLAGLFNYSYAEAGAQLAGLWNVAGDVNTGQVSGIFNKAKRVNGSQLGLVNISDTISGVPVGLLNIVKKGYNRVEVSASDALYANVAFRLGAHRFYNIFHFGARWDKLATNTSNATPGTYMSWGVGYGIGSAHILTPNVLVNMEALAIQINEQEVWTNQLNLLNQIRLTLDFHKKDGRISFFCGPSINVMLSQYRHPETGTLGSTVIQPYRPLLEIEQDGLSTQVWVGLQGGIRF